MKVLPLYHKPGRWLDTGEGLNRGLAASKWHLAAGAKVTGKQLQTGQEDKDLAAFQRESGENLEYSGEAFPIRPYKQCRISPNRSRNLFDAPVETGDLDMRIMISAPLSYGRGVSSIQGCCGTWCVC